MKHKLLFILTIALIMASGCEISERNEIEVELQQYFELFAEEGSARGVDITFEEIDIGGYVEQIQERGVLGQCRSYTDGSKTVVIDQNYWSRATELEREYIVFHELGHCALGRDHDDSGDQDGNCVSMMQSGSNDCTGRYDDDNRDRLLDELFEN